MAKDDVLLRTQRARRYYFWWWVLFWLFIPAAVALAITQPARDHPLLWCVLAVFIVPLLIAIIKRASLSACVHRDRVVIVRGILSKATKEIFIGDIRSIDVQQTLLQRILNLGDITITTVGRAETPNQIDGLPNPMAVKDLIIKLRKEAKEAGPAREEKEAQGEKA